MVVSGLLKIKLGHAQISVSKIGIPMSETACINQVVLVHDTRSNDPRSNDARFMHKLCINYTFLCMS